MKCVIFSVAFVALVATTSAHLTPLQVYFNPKLLVNATSHYEDPVPNGCQSGEEAVQIQGVAGDFCSPQCSSTGACPTDVPTGVTAAPTCALQTTTGAKYCALICSPSSANQCGTATCKSISGVGICTYNDAVADREAIERAFAAHVLKYGLTFKSADEYMKRLDIYAENDDIIKTHNAAGNTWTMAHNEYSHLTWDEFRSQKLGFAMPRKDVPKQREDLSIGATLPSSVDWTTKGAVTPVKNQGQCGSCWAFSTTGGLEGAYFLKYGTLESFSEQELVDCDHNGDQGCNGGLMDNAFGWITSNGGICKESDYSYRGVGGTCQSSSCSSVAHSAPASHTDVAQNEAALKAAVVQQPISIAIEADQLGFQFYSGGVFTGNCGTQLDHGVLLVGYGTQSGTDYWKVKNSWGASWGMSGYILLERGKAQTGGQCGILMSASYPTL